MAVAVAITVPSVDVGEGKSTPRLAKDVATAAKVEEAFSRREEATEGSRPGGGSIS